MPQQKISTSKHGYKALGRSQISFEDDTTRERLSYSALPFATYLGMPYRDWHLKKNLDRKISGIHHYREALQNNIIPLGEWSEKLFCSTTESSRVVIEAFITEHAKHIVKSPEKLIAGGGGAISPVTFAGILIVGFHILEQKFPNEHHNSLIDLQHYLDGLHFDIRSSHVIRFVNGVGNKHWYRDEEKKLQKFFPDKKEAALFKRILAITAIRADASSNATLAVKAFHQMKAGLPFTGFQGTVIKGLEKIRDEGIYTSKSTKTVSYTGALHGNSQSVAVDRWLTKQFGAARQYEFKGKKGQFSPSVPLQRAIQKYVAEIAYYTDLKPFQVSAMMWYAERTWSGTTSDRGYGNVLEKKLGGLFPLFANSS